MEDVAKYVNKPVEELYATTLAWDTLARVAAIGPATWSFWFGETVPIPTLPPLYTKSVATAGSPVS